MGRRFDRPCLSGTHCDVICQFDRLIPVGCDHGDLLIGSHLKRICSVNRSRPLGVIHDNVHICAPNIGDRELGWHRFDGDLHVFYGLGLPIYGPGGLEISIRVGITLSPKFRRPEY